MDYKKTAGIDLHIHSNASDGTFSPRDILLQAVEIGLKAIAITDHDTLSGTRELLNVPIPTTLKTITGVEISAAFPTVTDIRGSLHILGYGIRPNDPELNDALLHLQHARKNRNPLIIQKLNDINIDISLEEVQKKTYGQQMARPHIAQALVQKGIVKSIDEAFEQFLGRNGPAYVDKYRIDCASAIQMIRNAGGIPVLAHPYLLPDNDNGAVLKLVTRLKQMGLMGIEVYYPRHPPDVTSRYADMARRLDLLMTGGTDFHGDLTPDIRMGTGKGDFFIPFEIYERLTAAIKQ